MFYDILHGKKKYAVNIKQALELGILIGFDGQLRQDSKIERSILDVLITGLNKNYGREKNYGIEKVLAWLYVKTWNAYGEHMINYDKFVSDSVLNDYINEDELWTFEKKDVDAALVTMLYPRKEDTQTEEIKEMILERFDNDLIKYYDWSLKIRDEMVRRSYQGPWFTKSFITFSAYQRSKERTSLL